ncbi:MAG: ABC transporter permease [Clostridiales bacterium]|nr:ABC transporter permease [Clostridiales bacterium]MCF8021776.1 ABC transporter permease [Clostridiales bacterium]
MESIYIMSLRRIKQFYRSKPRILGSIAQPVLFLVALGLGFGPVFEQAGGINYIQYLAPGIIGMTLLFGSMMNGMSVIWDKQFGFLKETLVAPVSRFNLLIGRCLGGAVTSIIQGVVVFFISLLMGYHISNLAVIPVVLIVMLLIAFLFTLLGTVIASKIDDMEAFPTIMNFLVLPMFFLSGALFPLKNLPLVIEAITRINPMTYSVDLLRATMNVSYGTSSVLDLGILLVLIILLLFWGSILFEKIQT